MNETSRLVIVVGSVREGRFGPVVGFVGRRAGPRARRLRRRRRRPRRRRVPAGAPRGSPKYAGTPTRGPRDGRADARLDAADAFILVTPEYNHSYPASLKAAIDWHFTQWTAKPVAFVSYGGAAGGRHAVLHLENVLTELHAVTIRDGLAFPNYFATSRTATPWTQATEYAKAMLEQLAGGPPRSGRHAPMRPTPADQLGMKTCSPLTSSQLECLRSLLMTGADACR